MPITITPEWQQLALYAVAAAVVLVLLQRIPFVGRFIRVAFSFVLLALGIFLLLQHAPYQPSLARLLDELGLDRQQVVGDAVRIRMSPDGHFWANVRVNGVERRMLIDSGATMTALSEATAAAASIDGDTGLVPMMLRTANGVVRARTGRIDRLRIGSITARDLNVVITPARGSIDVLGMNFLSELESWRVEGRTLVLVPNSVAQGSATGALGLRRSS